MNAKLYLGEALGLLLKTTPFLWVRLGSYALLGLGLLVYFGVVGGVAWLLGQLWGLLGLVVMLAGFGGAFGIGIVRWVTRYWTVGNVLGVLPIPGLDGLRTFPDRVARFSMTYIDEAILTRAYREREPNVWAVARDGVILYAQCWKPVLANAVVLTLLSYVEFFVFLVLLGLPALALGAAVPALKVALGIGVLVGAWMLKLALADAYAIAATSWPTTGRPRG